MITSRCGNDFTVRVSVGKHELVADETTGFGGNDEGPSPFGLLLASVSACTAIAIVDAARERKLRLDGVVVSVKHKQNIIPKSHGDPRLLITEIRRRVELRGDLSPSDREWLFAQGAACPVSRTLAQGIEMKAELVD
jgi:uncharacterized OsmC-like protein